MAILRLPSVKAEIGYSSDASVYNDIRAGLFPKPVRIGQRAVGWPDYEVRTIVAARIASKTDSEIRVLVDQLHLQRAQASKLLLQSPAFAGAAT